MQVEILSVPEDGPQWVKNLEVGTSFTLRMEDVAMDIDMAFFDWNGLDHCLEDLIINGIEFKVVHEKAK